MHKPLLSTAYWLTYPQETRAKLVRLFGIPRSGGSVVETVMGVARVTSDGHSAEDLTAINTEILQRMLATESTDFYAMLSHVVERIDKLLEIKESGAVDGDWRFTEQAKQFDSDKQFKVKEFLEPGDIVKIKDGEVYKIARSPGRPKKNGKEEVAN